MNNFEYISDWVPDHGAKHYCESFDEIFTSVEKIQDGRLSGVLHCFSGNADQAKKTIDLGLHIGLGGVLTF